MDMRSRDAVAGWKAFDREHKDDLQNTPSFIHIRYVGDPTEYLLYGEDLQMKYMTVTGVDVTYDPSTRSRILADCYIQAMDNKISHVNGMTVTKCVCDFVSRRYSDRIQTATEQQDLIAEFTFGFLMGEHDRVLRCLSAL
jgi:hypothetical protein